MVKLNMKEQIQCSIETKNLKTKTELGKYIDFNTIPNTYYLVKT